MPAGAVEPPTNAGAVWVRGGGAVVVAAAEDVVVVAVVVVVAGVVVVAVLLVVVVVRVVREEWVRCVRVAVVLVRVVRVRVVCVCGRGAEPGVVVADALELGALVALCVPGDPLPPHAASASASAATTATANL